MLDKLSKQVLNQISQACLLKIKNANFMLVKYSIKLWLSCMYKGNVLYFYIYLKQDFIICIVEASALILHLDEQNVEDSTAPSDLDMIVDHFEKITTLFERLKSSNRDEARILCNVLSKVLKDLFYPSDVLAKVIGEFFSITQQHGESIAYVVLEVHKILRLIIKQNFKQKLFCRFLTT